MKKYHSTKGLMLYLYYILFFMFINISLASFGAYNTEGSYGRYKVVLSMEVMMILYLLKNYFFFKKITSLPFIVSIWIIWMVFNSLNILGYGIDYYILFLMDVLLCPLIFLYFYVYFKKKPDMIDSVKVMHIFLLIFSFILYLSIYKYKSAGQSAFSPLMNTSYYILLILPWILIIRNKVYNILGIIIISMAVVISMKRTASLAFVVSLVVYYLLEQRRVKGIISLRLLLQVVFLAALIYVLYSYFEQKTGGYFEQRIASSVYDKGSGRLDIYVHVLKLLANSNYGAWLYGHGHDTAKIYNAINGYEALSAHNDWLEIVFDYGLLGFIIYSLFHLFLIRYLWQLLKIRSFYGSAMAASYVIFFIMSLTSHLVLYPTYYSYLMSFWGVISALTMNNERKDISVQQ